MTRDWRCLADTKAETFPTLLGWMAAAIDGCQVMAIALPQVTEEAAWAALCRELGAIPARQSGAVGGFRAELEAYARGERVQFSAEPSLAGYSGFQKRVLEVVGRIPYGQLLTYGNIAELAGSPGASRAVGQAVHINRTPVLIPCHRVIAANQALGGFGGGITQKLRLLTLEGSLVPGALSFKEGEAAAPVDRVRRFLSLTARAIAVIETDDSTRTAPEAALALGVDVGQIAKSLLFMTDRRPTLVVTSGDKRVDAEKLKKTVGAERVSLADPATVTHITGFAVGGVAPVAHLRPAQVVLDVSMKRFPVVYAAAGSPHSAMPVSFDDLVAISAGEPGDVCL